MKKLFFFLVPLIILFRLPTHSQQLLKIDTSNFSIYAGDTVKLTATSSIDSNKILTDTMQNGFGNAFWSSTQANPVFHSPCGPGPGYSHYWIGITPTSQRYMRSAIFDLTNADSVSVSFWMRYGQDIDSGNCESPSGQQQGVHLQYSVNNGQNWTDFPGPDTKPVGNTSNTPPYVTQQPGSGGYWNPYPGPSAQNELFFWNKYNCKLPASALTSQTSIRWIQMNFNNNDYGIGYDTWGIGEIKVTLHKNEPALSQFQWNGNQPGLSAQYVFPDKGIAYDTVIKVSYTPAPVYSDSIIITVLPGSNGLMDELSQNGLKVYPVPADNFIIIEAEEQLPESYRIYDTYGRLLLTGRYEGGLSNIYRIDISGFSPGIYYLEILYKKNRICTGLIII